MGKITSDTLVVGLRGPAGVGKTTIAKALADMARERNYTMRLLSFAGPIKEGLAAMGICKNTEPEAYRVFAQEIGGGMRGRRPDHWVNLFKKHVKASGAFQVVVADDLRYPNEADLCDVIFRITPIGFDAANLGERADHESETWNRIDKTTGIEIINEVGLSERAARAINHYLNNVHFKERA